MNSSPAYNQQKGRRMSRIVPTLLCLFSMAACATTEAGWSGSGATPFGRAQEICKQETAPTDAFKPAFVACMERQGWKRGNGSSQRGG